MGRTVIFHSHEENIMGRRSLRLNVLPEVEGLDRNHRHLRPIVHDPLITGSCLDVSRIEALLLQ